MNKTLLAFVAGVVSCCTSAYEDPNENVAEIAARGEDTRCASLPNVVCGPTEGGPGVLIEPCTGYSIDFTGPLWCRSDPRLPEHHVCPEPQARIEWICLRGSDYEMGLGSPTAAACNRIVISNRP